MESEDVMPSLMSGAGFAFSNISLSALFFFWDILGWQLAEMVAIAAL